MWICKMRVGDRPCGDAGVCKQLQGSQPSSFDFLLRSATFTAACRYVSARLITFSFGCAFHLCVPGASPAPEHPACVLDFELIAVFFACVLQHSCALQSNLQQPHFK